jgi:hypothetical protein
MSEDKSSSIDRLSPSPHAPSFIISKQLMDCSDNKVQTNISLMDGLISRPNE